MTETSDDAAETGGDGGEHGDEDGDEVDFEEAVDRLEAIVEDLESGRSAESDLDLDRALELYEEGVGLVRACRDRLEDAEQRLETLDVDAAAPEPAEGGEDGDEEGSGGDDDGSASGRGRGDADAGPNDTLGGPE